MRPRIIFHETFPPALEDETLALLKPLLPLVGDLESLNVKITSSTDDDVPMSDAAIQVIRRYHTALLYLDARFFSFEAEDKRQTLLHEFMHIRLNVFSKEVQHILEHWLDPDLGAYIQARLDEAEEMATDALAHAFDRLIASLTSEDENVIVDSLGKLPASAKTREEEVDPFSYPEDSR